jgi:para-aminobenzoate synthetase component I
MRTFVPDRTTFVATAQPGARCPVVTELPLEDRTPAELYRSLRAAFGSAVLLESGKTGRYSFVGIAGGERFVSTGRSLAFPDDSTSDGDPFDALRGLIADERMVAHPLLAGFSGGYVGYLAYDMARHIERLPDLTIAQPAIPDCAFLLVESFCEIDHEERVLRLAVAPRVGDDPGTTYDRAVLQLERMHSAISSRAADGADVAAAGDPGRSANMSQDQFESIVRRAKEYIRAGDVFQVNLSLRIEEEFNGDPLALYRSLREVNPAPYMALLELPELAIVSASPELLLRVRDRVIETRPIAGTRPRGATAEEDERNARKLSENEKERAEHLMLVDLERNDIGRVARYGSVRVDEFMGIERYSHVIHIVSHVRGELDARFDTIDAIRACFPGGTITGAPKVRSMEIIEELEPHRRGVYTGSIGWIGFDGNAELNIAIRTIVVADGIAYVQAGAGIVADSEPEHEYRESLRKAEAAIVALERTHDRRIRTH